MVSGDISTASGNAWTKYRNEVCQRHAGLRRFPTKTLATPWVFAPLNRLGIPEVPTRTKRHITPGMMKPVRTGTTKDAEGRTDEDKAGFAAGRKRKTRREAGVPTARKRRGCMRPGRRGGTTVKCGRPCWARTNDQRIMRTTSAFAARFRFVVWTLPCLSAFPSSLYTFSGNPELRSALARHRRRRQSVCRI